MERERMQRRNFRLFPADIPGIALNALSIVREFRGYYDNLSVHRMPESPDAE
jgi:hypothetical protein